MNPGQGSNALIELDAVRKSYNIGQPNEAEVLHSLGLRVTRGEFVALMGPSGSGKSTLLNLIGLLERMTAGSYKLLGEEVHGRYIDVKAAQADRCPKALGSRIKTAEVQFHHEVTNQYLWNQF